MPKRTTKTGSELFIVDNSENDWQVVRYLHDWCQLSQSIDIATAYFEIGSLLALKDEWQKVDHIRILMGDEVSLRTRNAFEAGLTQITQRLDGSLEAEKQSNDFLAGVPAIVEAIRSGKIECRVYRKEKFHAKAYITHARLEVVGSIALVGSSNFTHPGICQNIELNVQITGRPVTVLQEWYDQHWAEAEDVTPEILRTIERHTREYSPFEVYAKALHELLHRHEMTDLEWLETQSRVYPILDRYQKDGFDDLMETARRYRGAFLCDSVGLGKTFIGLMVMEHLIERQRKRVALFVTKAARKPVWERALEKYLPHISGDFSNLAIFNHTDLLRGGDFPRRLQKILERADAFVIDEAHHFRNPGLKATEGQRKSHYWQLYDIAEGKTMYLLTATPINNRLLDLQHMIELFSRRQPDYFKAAPLGIHSLPGHFRRMEKELEQLLYEQLIAPDGGVVETNQAEAEQLLSNDALFRALVIQRSRAYVKQSQEQHGGTAIMFPTKEPPRVQAYSIKKTCGRLLALIEQAFDREKPLFSLAIYYPLAYPANPQEQVDAWLENRQKQVVGLIRVQFLKRFESSVSAFEASCHTLLLKLLAWLTENEPTGEELRRFERWHAKYSDLLDYVAARRRQRDGDDSDDEEDIVPAEMLEDAEKLDREEYRVDEIINETIDDLDRLAEFIQELRKFKPSHDDKLKALVSLLKTDPVLKRHKVIIFTEFMDTARYLRDRLEAAGITGVDEVDSASSRDRGEIITRFAPYYNESSSAQLAEAGQQGTRVLISTDVLSEGLNLQDATRLINYDIHWNPVRLMQRIGRVDRRMTPEIEARMLADHPDQAEIRGTVVYWNFLPPEELDDLLRLYGTVAHKVLRISKVFGIEGKKLLTPDDDFEALKEFTHKYEGTPTPVEDLLLEHGALLKEYPDLEARLHALPGRVFSGKEHPQPDTKAVFFCYALPAADLGAGEPAEGQEVTWSEDAGPTRWYLYDLATGDILDDPSRIVEVIRSAPDTPRHCVIERATLSDIRKQMDKHIRNTYLKQVQAPVGVKPRLIAWMELS